MIFCDFLSFFVTFCDFSCDISVIFPWFVIFSAFSMRFCCDFVIFVCDFL